MEINYLIKSEKLDKLYPQIKKAVNLIKKCIEDKNPILIRHHSDADGFSGGVALEKAILPLIYDTHARERDAYYVYSRKVNSAPYYSYDDANKDLAYFLSDKGKYEYKKPLIIIVDNGSSLQDILSIRKLKIYDAKIIVIDHHPHSKEVEDAVDVLVNPHTIGSTYDFSAGMLCSEIANILNPSAENLILIAATSAISDKVKSREQEDYLALAEKAGYSHDFIVTLSEILDFEAMSLSYTESRHIMEDIFGKDKEKQKKLIELLKEEVDRLKLDALNSAKKYSHISRTDKQILVLVPVSAISFRGNFPPSGKIVGMMHDFVSKSEGKPTISLGFSESMITFRATSDTTLDVNKIISSAKLRFPYAQISGGGHAKAGSIRFIPQAYEEIREFVLQEVRKWIWIFLNT